MRGKRQFALPVPYHKVGKPNGVEYKSVFGMASLR